MAWRALLRSPGFTAAAVLLLAVGIGGTAVVFSITDALLLRRLEVTRPGELVRIVEIIPGRPPVSMAEYDVFEDWLARTRSFSAAIAEFPVEVSLGDGADTRRIRANVVTGDYFDVLGVHATVGRLLTRDDERAAAGDIPAVISYAFWQSEFHGDPRVLGHVLRLNRRAFTVVGVMPRGFNGVAVESGPQVRLPWIAGPIVGGGPDPHTCCAWEIVGRLRPGVTMAQAEPETAVALKAAQLAVAARTKLVSEEVRRAIEGTRYALQSLEYGVSKLRERFGAGLVAVMGGAVLLLLLACVNIAGLMVARAAAREREMALRAALGPTRSRLVRHWLSESALVAALGGVVGLAFAMAILPLVGRAMPPLRDLAAILVPVSLDTRLDWRVFLLTFAMCAGAALLAGIAPAWHGARANLMEPLKATPSDPRRARLRAVLTVAQVAISTVVLANSALLVGTLHALKSESAGFDREHVVTFTVDSDVGGPSERRGGPLALRLEREARALPGVRQASVADRGLMRGTGIKTGVGMPGEGIPRDLNASTNTVSPGYFETMGMQVTAGRGLMESDEAPRKPAPVVVNQSFARRFFPDGNAIGRRFGTGMGSVAAPAFEVVGVVTDTRYRSLREPFQPIIYACFSEKVDKNRFGFQIEVRTWGRPASVIASMRAVMRRVDPDLPFREVRTLAEDVDDSLWAERALAGTGTIFSTMASLVACVGLYGLLSYAVAQRRREIGIRMALGARPGEIARGALVRVLGLVAAGAALGTAVALWTGRFLESVLYEVQPGDGRAIAAAWVLVMVTGAIAAVGPAWRAARVNPSDALRG